MVNTFPQISETFLVNKFLGLLSCGVEAEVICRETDQQKWDNFEQLRSRPELRRRVRQSCPVRPGWKAALLAPLALTRALLREPRRTVRYLARGWAAFGSDVFRRLYLDVDLILARPDIIHFEFATLAVGRMYIGRILDCKVVVSFRGHDLNTVGLDQAGYYDEIWKFADGIHLLGEDLWRRARRRGCPDGKRKALIPPAVDLEFFQPTFRRFQIAGSSERPLRLLSVGRADWKKGYEFALEALKQLRGRGLAVEYRIVGGGEHLDAIAFCRSQLGLDDCVSLLGAQNAEEVRSQMAWADILLHSAVSEGFCNSVMEAMSMGLPVIASDAGGLPENVQDGETGFIVPRRDAQAIAEAVAEMAGNPSARERMSIAARHRVRRLFRLTDQIDSFVRFYQDVAGCAAERAGTVARVHAT